ncbi:FAD-dependent oxidoreductase [Solidesulfovibrio carbinolicus]|uniref:Oxidoreductase n=1 Tax=Solidesulfovibrio carbinolicus TaxID=296842 RepID=A0A4V0YQV8_9BACT|nr:FAD-dependent oxidoreductase [Solidesulfovibrio carbinolicus]QAZ67652.1 oxidoreductase [Solidesulfovibrio carbinolicus]
MEPQDILPVAVAGGGPAGLRAALDLAAAGHDVLLIEAGPMLGGAARHLAALVQTGQPAGPALDALAQAVAAQPRIRLLAGCRLLGVTGSPRDLVLTIRQAGEAGVLKLRATVLILATGLVPYHPGGLDFFGHGPVADVITSIALETMLAAGRVRRPSDDASPASVAFIQCVGSRMRRPEERPACSSLCCAVSLRQALALPETRRTIYAMDLRVHAPGGQALANAAEASGAAVRHARPHTLEAGPEGRGVIFRLVDEQGAEVLEQVDLAVLAVGLGPSPQGRELAAACGLETDKQGFVPTNPFAPAVTNRPGVFVAGGASGPADAAMATVQGSAAALEALACAPVPNPRRDTPAVLVVGGGAAGLACSLGLAEGGVPVVLLEKAEALGGNPRKHPTVWKGSDTRQAVAAMAEAVTAHPNIEVLCGARLVGLTGRAGDWTGEAHTPSGQRLIAFGAAVLALGGAEARVDSHLYGRDPRVMTQLEFENWRRLHPGPDEAPRLAAFIQCVGSRQGQGGYDACARTCCAQALQAAVELKKARPDAQVAVFHRDVTAYGRFESLYTEARRLGVAFFRYDDASPAQVERLGPDLVVAGFDRLLGREVRLRPDVVILAAPLVPSGLDELAGLFDLPRGHLGFFIAAHPVFAPVDLPQPGLFAAGLCLGPKPLDESVAEGRAAAMRALAYLSGRA